MGSGPPIPRPTVIHAEQVGQDDGLATSSRAPISTTPGKGCAQGSRALVVSSLVSFVYRLCSSVFGSMCWRRSRTLTVFGELLS
jgi:hypothetical protein